MGKNSNLLFEMGIEENIRDIKDRIRRAAERVGRNPEGIVLVAATKTVDTTRILEALDQKITVCGESRVQEALPKLRAISKRVVWHFIGHLQKNKVKYIIGDIKLIHSVDSVELAEELDRRAQKKGIVQDILLEVNISGEKTKYGVLPYMVYNTISEILDLKGIAIKGLMAMAPYSDNPEDSRPYYRRLRELRDDIILRGIRNKYLKELSMGMSGDFEIGVEEGATFLRIGTAIFGERMRGE